jgi:hypothetical protein
MALQDGAQIKVIMNGGPVTLVSSISRRTESGVVRIEVLEGLAGFSHSSGACTLEMSFPIMIGGTEHPYHAMAARREYVDFQVFEGAVSYIGRGKLETVESSQSVGNASEGSLTWTGELAAPE